MVDILESSLSGAIRFQEEVVGIDGPVWSNPKIWIISSIILVILTAVLIYYKVLIGSRRI
jgi:hypothetical protein